MIIGSVKELKAFENRVGLLPVHAYKYIEAGHKVIVESGLGIESGFSDQDYRDVGVEIIDDVAEVWRQAEMIIKVKEPVAKEYNWMREGQIIFTYFHLAANAELAQQLIDKKVTALAYETITDENGNLPLLKPMSEVAGYLAIQEGGKYLERIYGGKGILLSEVSGVPAGNVVILGAGAVGYSALIAADRLGSHITVIDINEQRLKEIEATFSERVKTRVSNEKNIIEALKNADLIVSSVLLPGAKAPKLIKKEFLKYIENGTVIVDVAIDQGGTTETSRPTTHDKPIYIEEGVIHYCVSNMPGAVPKTSSSALGNATIDYGLKVATQGILEVAKENPGFALGINTYQGAVVNKAVADALQLEYREVDWLEESSKA